MKGSPLRLARLLPLSLLLSAAAASPAVASTQIGQLGEPFESGICTGTAVMQTGVAPGTNPYAVPAAGGVITSWQTQTGKDAGTVKLKMFRKTAVAGEYLAVGEDGPRQVKSNTSPIFTGVRIQVQGGDLLGDVALGTNCNSRHIGVTSYTTTGFDKGVDPAVGTTNPVKFSTTEFSLQIVANVEPDADRDGYGDETQDACPADGTAQILPCPVILGPPSPPPPDLRAARIALSSRARQEALRTKAVIAVASADEAVTFTASGSVNVPGAGAFSLTPGTVPGAANTKTTIRLGLVKSVRKKIAAALKKGKRVKASIHVVAKDAAGNPSNATQAVTIKKSAPTKQK